MLEDVGPQILTSVLVKCEREPNKRKDGTFHRDHDDVYDAPLHTNKAQHELAL